MPAPSDIPPRPDTAAGGGRADAVSHEQFVTGALEAHESALIGYAASLVLQADSARDLVRETFLHLAPQAPGIFGTELKLRLFADCRSRALELLRKERPNQPLDDIRWRKVAGPDQEPVDLPQPPGLAPPLLQALETLTDSQREVILLKFRHQFRYSEIQHITGLTPANISFLVHTGLRHLRNLPAPPPPDVPSP